MVSPSSQNLWNIVRHPFVDAAALASAIEMEVSSGDLDYRSRLLVRDSLNALEQHWGPQRLNRWLVHSPHQSRLQTIRDEFFERIGYPTLEKRLMDFTSTEEIEQMFRFIGLHLRKPVKLAIGGSIALILPGLVARHTEDVDVVDEVPAELRNDHPFLNSLKERFGLELAHFQSHHLPMGWESRTKWHGQYDELTVVLVDPIDVFLSKLFSIRDKDFNDTRVLIKVLAKQSILDRLHHHCQSMWVSDSLRERAQKNWYTLTGEHLPT